MALPTRSPSAPRTRRHPRTAIERAEKVALVVGILLVILAPTGAHAHGDLEGTIPKPGSKLEKPPDHLIINFTEAPTKQSVVTVRDGCRNDVVEDVAFEDRTAHVFLDAAEPGRWNIEYEVISSSDGHKTDGSYELQVKGKRVCAVRTPPGGTGEGKGRGPEARGDIDEDEGDDEGSFPVVPVALGTGGVVALALVIRRLSG